jgi:hypothetical protein
MLQSVRSLLSGTACLRSVQGPKDDMCKLKIAPFKGNEQ